MIHKSGVVIGTWPLSGDYGLVGLKTIQETLEHCYNSGFKEFDTAPGYGEGFMEFCLGNVFHEREDVLINTKIGVAAFKQKSFELKNLQESFEQSLKRISKDSINVLFLHNPRDEVRDFAPILEFMDRLKSEGKIRQKGISIARNYDYGKKVDLSEFDVIQDDANLLAMNFLKIKYPKNTKFMARSPLANGLLFGNITINSDFPKEDQRSEWLKGKRLVSILKRVEALKKIGKENRIELPSLARRFLLNNKKIDKIIFGVKKTSHVGDIIRDLNNPPLNRNIDKKLIELFEGDFGLVNEKHLGY